MKTVAIVQARTGSTRLPGKVLLPLLGEPILSRVLRRVSRSGSVDQVVVATTTLAADDTIVEVAEREGVAAVRGSEVDLLDRYLRAARLHEASSIVRVTSDCPLIDPSVIDDVVDAFDRADCDYASNTLPPRTFPLGLDVEVIARDALERAAREDTNPAWREHATPYLYRHPESFVLVRVPAASDWSMHRWTVDTDGDYELVRRIYDAIGRDDFGWKEALAVVEAHPEWMDLNRDVVQKVVPAG